MNFSAMLEQVKTKIYARFVKGRCEKLSEKKQTSKSVMREIEKAERTLQNRMNKIQELKNEISEISKNKKEFIKLYEILYQEELKSKIATAWFKEQKMTDKQILKLIEVGSQTYDKIDILETNVVVNAVNQAYNEQISQEGKVTISGNFSKDDSAEKSGRKE